MVIGIVKVSTLLSFVKAKFGTTATFTQEDDGYGRITYYDKVTDSDINVLAWSNEGEGEMKMLEYIFLNKVK